MSDEKIPLDPLDADTRHLLCHEIRALAAAHREMLVELDALKATTDKDRSLILSPQVYDESTAAMQAMRDRVALLVSQPLPGQEDGELMG